MHKKDTSWQKVSGWYAKETKDDGHYYHRQIIIPSVLKLLNLKTGDFLLDLACGGGVLGRAISPKNNYLGIDAASGLITAAKQQDKSHLHRYLLADITKPLEVSDRFSHAACILAIQNVSDPKSVFVNAAKLLKPGGQFVIVMNHPCFRIPRQSSWGIDEASKLQYRRVNRYVSPLEIPMSMHPGSQDRSPVTWSYHFPLSSYITWLAEAGFMVTGMEEWVSDKESQGKARKMENRSRAEIPLFMMIRAQRS